MRASLVVGLNTRGLLRVVVVVVVVVVVLVLDSIAVPSRIRIFNNACLYPRRY